MDNPASEAEQVERQKAAFAACLDRVLAEQEAVGLNFQPIVDLKGGVVAGYEVLARFPAEMNAPPNVCFERAARLGKRLALEQVTFDNSLRCRQQLPANCFLSVNVSPDFLLSPAWQSAVNRVGDLSGIVMELTEEAAIEEYEEVRWRTDTVRRLGGMIAVDDAGAGYASLSHILQLRPEFIKLDRAFVQNCHTDPAKETMIEMIGAAANRLDAWIIAEGVEVGAEMDELTLLGVPLAQGFFLGRPAPRMRAVEEAALASLRTRQQHTAQEDSLLLAATACRCFRGIEEAGRYLQAMHEGALAVVLDPNDRPVCVVEKHPLIGCRKLFNFLRVQAETDSQEVVQRALHRELRSRHDPVVIIGPEGEFRGVAELARLMQWALRRGARGPREGLSSVLPARAPGMVA